MCLISIPSIHFGLKCQAREKRENNADGCTCTGNQGGWQGAKERLDERVARVQQSQVMK